MSLTNETSKAKTYRKIWRYTHGTGKSLMVCLLLLLQKKTILKVLQFLYDDARIEIQVSY
jgi:hypothetical protein